MDLHNLGIVLELKKLENFVPSSKRVPLNLDSVRRVREFSEYTSTPLHRTKVVLEAHSGNIILFYRKNQKEMLGNIKFHSDKYEVTFGDYNESFTNIQQVEATIASLFRAHFKSEFKPKAGKPAP